MIHNRVVTHPLLIGHCHGSQHISHGSQHLVGASLILLQRLHLFLSSTNNLHSSQAVPQCGAEPTSSYTGAQSIRTAYPGRGGVLTFVRTWECALPQKPSEVVPFSFQRGESASAWVQWTSASSCQWKLLPSCLYYLNSALPQNKSIFFFFISLFWASF